jgi:histidyl-tRNA synthetase
MAGPKISTKPPSGMRDFLPMDVARRRHVVGVIERVYQSFGFVPLETPAIENLDTLLGKYGDEGDQLLYRLLHRRDALKRALDEAHAAGRTPTELALADQGLRYDLTVPLARVVAQYGELPKFFKRYQIQPVWRADRPGRGRFREFYQCDVDITGTTAMVAEAEVCAAVATVLDELGFSDYRIRVNHRQLLRAMVRAAGIDETLEGTALVAIDKLDKIGREGVIAELEQRGIAASAGSALLDLVTRDPAGDDRRDLQALAEKVDARGREAIEALRSLWDHVGGTRAGPRFTFSPDLARGLGYYTGPIFEIAVADLAGSLGGGGRYDDLVGMFGKKTVPAVGFSIGLERILVVMEERGMYPPLRVGPDALLCWFGVEPARVLEIAAALRAGGARVEVFPESTQLGKQLTYANTLGLPTALILGDGEAQSGEITVKDLASGEQRRVPVAEAAALVAAQRGG